MQTNEPISYDTAHWMELRQKSCDRNSAFHKRIIAGTHEKISYAEENTPVFLWINKEPGNFPLHWHSTAEIIMPVENG